MTVIIEAENLDAHPETEIVVSRSVFPSREVYLSLTHHEPDGEAAHVWLTRDEALQVRDAIQGVLNEAAATAPSPPSREESLKAWANRATFTRHIDIDDSSVVADVAYSPDERIMLVGIITESRYPTFYRRYAYFGVEPEVFSAVAHAPSAGRWYNTLVKGQYESVQVQ